MVAQNGRRKKSNLLKKKRLGGQAAYRSTIVTRSDRSPSRPAAVLIWFVAEYTAPDAFPDLSHTVVTLPSLEIDGLCVVSPLADETTQVLSKIVSMAPSQAVQSN